MCSSYPCNYENINLPRINYLKTLSKKLDAMVICCNEDAIAAIVMGAEYIEKHFTIDKKLPGRDKNLLFCPMI